MKIIAIILGLSLLFLFSCSKTENTPSSPNPPVVKHNYGALPPITIYSEPLKYNPLPETYLPESPKDSYIPAPPLIPINQYNSDTDTPTTSSPSQTPYTYHQNGTSSWTPKGSDYTYHQDGSSSWTPKGSDYTYHQDGSSSWTPEGSDYTYHQDGSSSWTPKGSDYTYHQR